MPHARSALLVLALLVGAPASAQALLQIRVEGLRSDRGTVRIAVFDSEETYLGDTPYAALRPVVGRASSWAVSLPPGTYAIAVHHDVDDDGKMARGLFNLPKEPVGFSNGARIRFGPPAWSRTRFRLPADGTSVTIRVR